MREGRAGARPRSCWRSRRRSCWGRPRPPTPRSPSPARTRPRPRSSRSRRRRPPRPHLATTTPGVPTTPARPRPPRPQGRSGTPTTIKPLAGHELPSENTADRADAQIVGHDTGDHHAEHRHGLGRIGNGHDQIEAPNRAAARPNRPRSCSTRTPRAHTTRMATPRAGSATRASRSTAKRAPAGPLSSTRRSRPRWHRGWRST